MNRRCLRPGLLATAVSWATAGGLVAVSLLPRTAGAQQVSMDRGVRAGGLWCFPLAVDSLSYVYLPASVQLATGDQGQPQFSFVRYVVNTSGDSTSQSGITEARGGGVLHFIVELETSDAAVDAARRELPRLLKNDHVALRGPIVFEDGRYTLVSSILSADQGSSKPHVVATGRAPVLEGNRIALSFDLDPEHATLLLKSFAMSTPDVSLVFDMTLSGLSDAYDAELTIDWSEMRKTQTFKTGGSYYYCSADLELGFDEMMRNNAIKLRTAGNDPPTEALLNTVYDKLLTLLFKPVEPDRVPAANQGGISDAIGGMLSGKTSSRKMLGFGAELAYQLREMKSEGRSVLDFHHRAAVQRHALITFNLGDFQHQHGNDPRFFRTVNLGDPAFQQREVQVGVDGALLPEFDRSINNVTVTLRKTHANGEQTLQEVVLDRSNAGVTAAPPRMIYGWDGDQDRLAWLGYDYRTRWSFKGGGVFETAWTPSDAPMIDLFAPFERRTVQLAGDPAALRARGVRAVVVQLDYPFFGEHRRPQLVLRPEESPDEKHVEVTLPLGQPDYDVTLTWQMAGAQRLTAQRRDSSGLIFVDDMP